MAKRKTIKNDSNEVYVPKQDNQIYIYIQRTPNRFMPIPYTWKPTFNYIKKLINESDGVYTKQNC